MKPKFVGLILVLSLSGIQATVAFNHFNTTESIYREDSYAYVSLLSRDTHTPIWLFSRQVTVATARG